MCDGLPGPAVPDDALSGLAFSQAIRPRRSFAGKSFLRGDQPRRVADQSDRLEIGDDVVVEL